MGQALGRLALVSATLLGAVLTGNGCATAGDDDGDNPRRLPDGGQPPPYDGGGGSGGFGPDDSGSGVNCPEIGDNLGRTVRVSRCPPRAGETLVVTGTGWPAQASLDVRFCAPSVAPNIERSCPWTETLAVGADGTFATQFEPRSVFPVNYGATAFGSALMLDCAAAPGACTVEVREASAPESAALRAPYAPLPDLNRKAALDLRAPLIADLPVRFIGSGWSTGVSVSAWLCGGAVPFAGFAQGFRFCNGRALFDSDAAGNFRIYAAVPGTFQSFLPPGIGILAAGVSDHVIAKNTVAGNNYVGIGVLGWCTANEGTPNACALEPPIWDPRANNNLVAQNKLFGNGLSPPPIPTAFLAADATYFQFEPDASGNCFEKNKPAGFTFVSSEGLLPTDGCKRPGK